jgi:Lipopolysaccharide-assembly
VIPARVTAGVAVGTLVALLALLGAGCSGYQLGDPATLPFASIHVAPPVNASLAPQAAALVGASLTRALDRSGRVTIAAENSADALLALTLVDYRREVAAERSDDTSLARKWRVTLTAECTLTRRSDGHAWFTRRSVHAFDEVYVDSGLVPAEYGNMPVLADRLAQEVAREVLGAW